MMMKMRDEMKFAELGTDPERWADEYYALRRRIQDMAERYAAGDGTSGGTGIAQELGEILAPLADEEAQQASIRMDRESLARIIVTAFEDHVRFVPARAAYSEFNVYMNYDDNRSEPIQDCVDARLVADDVLAAMKEKP